jgi:hypothetical protein
MKKFFTVSVIALLVIFLTSNISVAQVRLLGGGATTKIHKLDLFGTRVIEPTINAVFEFGHRFEQENTKIAKIISTDLSIGLPSATLMSKSFSRGIALEAAFKLTFEQVRDNPLGAYIGVSFGHMSTLPVRYEEERGKIIYFLGEKALEPFYKMAKEKKKMIEDYADVDAGVSYEHDSMKFGVSYGFIHQSICLSITHTLPWHKNRKKV